MRTKGCSTRLKKHAPSFIEISDRPTNPFAPSIDSSNAIPLLSPLILNPQTETTIQTQMLQNNGNYGNAINNEAMSSHSSSNMQSNVWKHPAMAPFSESSSLCNFLQKQCVIVNNTQ